MCKQFKIPNQVQIPYTRTSSRRPHTPFFFWQHVLINCLLLIHPLILFCDHKTKIGILKQVRSEIYKYKFRKTQTYDNCHREIPWFIGRFKIPGQPGMQRTLSSNYEQNYKEVCIILREKTIYELKRLQPTPTTTLQKSQNGSLSVLNTYGP